MQLNQINKEDIENVLRNVNDPVKGQNLIDAKRISSIVIRDAAVGFAIEIEDKEHKIYEPIRKECERVVGDIKGVEKVSAVLTSTLRKEEKEKQEQAKYKIPGVKNVILVAAGKGGVGKSTVSVNMAVALKDKGFKVGVVDADIYGPSIPKMLGVAGEPKVENNKMIPHEKNGIKSLSMGYLIPSDKATVWRGPMVIKALYQLLQGAIWEDVDYLIVDLPPGTGDIQLSLAKNFFITGAIIVSTPQEVALLDVVKAADMFEKTGVKILGVIENMAYFLDPVSNNKTYIFGEGGAKKFADVKGYKFLGEIPLQPEIRENADNANIQPNESFTKICKEFLN